jgi:hypothetical protein
MEEVLPKIQIIEQRAQSAQERLRQHIEETRQKWKELRGTYLSAPTLMAGILLQIPRVYAL